MPGDLADGRTTGADEVTATVIGTGPVPGAAVVPGGAAAPVVLLAAGLTVAAGAWLALALAGGDRSMRLGVLTGGPALMSPAAMEDPAFLSMDHSMAGMDMSAMDHSGGMAMTMLGATMPVGAYDVSLPVFLGFARMWLVMVLAMMLPVLLPMALRRTETVAGPAPLVASVRFVLADLAVWTAAGLPAYALLVAFQAWVPQPGPDAVRVAAALVLVAGAYGFTRLKARARQECCAGATGVPACCVPPAGRGGDWAAGAVHGVQSLACCGPLMLALLMLGTMNLAWMAILTLVMLLERWRPWGVWVSHAASAALLVTGAALLVYPAHLPALV